MIYFSEVRILPKGSHKSGGPINRNSESSGLFGNSRMRHMVADRAGRHLDFAKLLRELDTRGCAP